MAMRLRELIKLIRETKTAQEEREIVARECADIRTSFKKEENDLRARNICKLIYVNLLGYATHFAQMDCLKLIVSSSYSDKRVGYLGLMMLLDERQEVLMLVTNSLKNDLRHVNQYVVGLALAAIGNIASAELSRDCAPEVEKLLDSVNPYIRKKAALAAIRIIRKVPDLIDQFSSKVKGMISEKNHGVLITGTALMIEMCKLDANVIPGFRKLVPTLVRIFSSLLQYGFSPEYDVGGVTDPFLQVKILRLLRLLGADDAESSDSMNMILASVATNTDNVRNVGNAILYECVNTIMGIDSEAALRVLAINTLGRFLANRDNNIRYVALNTLCTVVNIDTEAVQRHRNTIVDCLKDNDISIRRRALELIYSLVNSQNVRVLVRELINFLQIADIEFRADLTAKLCIVAEKYAPTAKWHVDTILRVMTIAGAYVPESTQNTLLALIAQTPDIQTYAVQKMFLALQTDLSQQTLVRCAIWCIGEFGEYLLNPSSSPTIQQQQQSNNALNLLGIPATDSTNGSSSNATTATGDEDSPLTVRASEADLVNIFHEIFIHVATKTSTRRQALTAMAKLSTRFGPNSEHIVQLRNMIAEFETHINAELQQRATEYQVILDTPGLPSRLLMKIPPPEIKAMISAESSNESAPQSKKSTRNKPNQIATPSTSNNNNASNNDQNTVLPVPPSNIMEDLLNFSSGSAPKQLYTASPVNPTSSNNEVLASLFSSNPVSSSPISTAMPVVPQSSSPMVPMQATILTPTGTASPNGTYPTLTVFTSPDGSVVVNFDISKPQLSNPQFTLINATYINNGHLPISHFDLKVSIPKYLKMQMPDASSNTIDAGQSSNQVIRLVNTAQGQKPVQVRLRVEYVINGETKTYLAEPQLPADL